MYRDIPSNPHASPQVTCFLPYMGQEATRQMVQDLSVQPDVAGIFVFMSGSDADSERQLDLGPGRLVTIDEPLESTRTLLHLVCFSRTPYTLIVVREAALRLGPLALRRLVRIAEDTDAGMLYADHYTLEHGRRVPTPAIDYQLGSLRDDFDFGPLLLFSTLELREALLRQTVALRYAGLYDLRLKLSRRSDIVHVHELLYTVVAEGDRRTAEKKQFDYVDPRHRSRQQEMEDACTDHLKSIGAFLKLEQEMVDLGEGIGCDIGCGSGEGNGCGGGNGSGSSDGSDGGSGGDIVKGTACSLTDSEEAAGVRTGRQSFPVEATVVIPVKDRVGTIRDALRSALSQQTTFPFNVIVVDNHSTDGTTAAIAEQSRTDARLIHVVPDRTDLGIGGCWNVAVGHPQCGKFVVQLDSDDLYSDAHTLQTIVRTFYARQCAMVVGSYRLVDFQLNPIPPGIIDHREWTDHNGPNNALRINGLGAPRAFYTPLLRRNPLPNVSYGEDYAAALAITRRYRLGRIYDVLYLCRRWKGNSDHGLDTDRINAHNLYKDSIRTQEVMARIVMNRRQSCRNE